MNTPEWFPTSGNGYSLDGLMQSLASPGWSEVVQALLHTIWEGAIVAAVLFFILRRTVNPITRHRCCLLAMAAVVLLGLCTWAVLDSRRTVHPSTAVLAASVASPSQTSAPANAVGANVTLTPSEVGKTGATTPTAPAAPSREWVAWFALAWLAGIVLMLARATWSVAGAEKLRRRARPLEDETMLRLIEEARRKLGLARRVRAVVTEKLTSPAVAGILVPTLILPLSLMTSMPANQLQLIVLHELAHIRRGDYLANLLQLLAESLLFFNPAVWWISRQLRHEREACCDAVAIALAGGERVEYARALACVAKHSLEGSLAATPAFANAKDRPGLADRVRRVLAPGARPQLRLTWRALAGSLFFGGTLFLLSALGTQWTVQAAERLLTPQERIDRIETDMKDFGQPLGSFGSSPTNKVELTIQVRTADGSPLPPRLRSLYSDIRTGNSSGGGPVTLDSNGVGKMSLQGTSSGYLGAWPDGYAPARLGPLTAASSNAAGHFDLLLDHGFGISIQVLDADSGKPVPGAVLSYIFAFLGPNMYYQLPHPATAGDDGVAHLTNCASFPLHLRVEMNGYEPGETVFEHIKANDELKLYTRQALPIAGQVTDATSGQPIAGASIYVIHAIDAPGVGDINPWGIRRYRDEKPNAVADADGHFAIDRLPQSGRYLLMARAAGHAGVMLYDTRPGQTNLSAALGPEIVVRGRIEGDLNLITDDKGHARIAPQFITDRPMIGTLGSMAGDAGYSSHGGVNFGDYADVRVENGVGYFEFTNLTAGQVRIEADRIPFTTNVTASVNDWLIQLPEAAPAGKDKREVVLRFVSSSGVAPQGTISVRSPRPMHGRPPFNNTELTLTNGEVHYDTTVGDELTVEPAHTVGFWFGSQSVKITEGSDAQIVTIPTVPAGAIYAEAQEPDGSVASDVLFSVDVMKPSPLQPQNASLGTSSGDGTTGSPRHYVATPLPLGGTYRIIAWFENHFSASEPITLTEAKPDQKLTLQFRPGVPLQVQVLNPAGQPATNVDVEFTCNFDSHSFGLKPAFTDLSGKFEYDNCEPSSGKFLLTLRGPGLRGTILEVDPKRSPIIVHMQPGGKIAGQLLNKATGKPVPQAIVNAWVSDYKLSAKLPREKTAADEQGRFVLDTLGDASYYVNANLEGWGYGSAEARADEKKDVVIRMVPYGTPQ